jgi:hypothetical protein
VIIVSFWIMVLGVLGYAGMLALGGVHLMQFSSSYGLLLILGAILLIPFGILYVRIMHELMIIFFRVHETLKDIHRELEKQRK